MCGISGFVDFKNNSTEQILQRMTDTMTHRGPDGSGYYLHNGTTFQVGFGHRRLSIIDLSEHGSQPMTFEHLTICFNGEIYNYSEIKNELITRGHSFVGNSDTEMILHAYEVWGEKCLDKFIGMFAIVIHDRKSNQLFCARDRAGVKPFFYYWHNGLFLFASELKAFHEHPSFVKEIDISAVGAFMQFGNIPTPHCIFKHCKKLEAGHHFTIDLSNPHDDFSEQQYWNVYDAYNAPKLDITYNEAMEKTEGILESAFQYRMVADVPVGVFLSGGYDSACVTALLQKNRSEKLKTFTIGVPDIGLNEAPYAKEVAAHLGTDHHEFQCTQKEALDLIPDLPFFYDEPFADSSAIPTSLVSMMARKEVTVALSADAGDEIFAGYNRYDYLQRYGNKLKKIPGVFRHSMAYTMEHVPSDRIPVMKHKYNFHNRYEKIKQLLRDPSDEKIMLSLSQQFTDQQISGLFNSSISAFDTAYLSKELINNRTSLAYMMAIDYQTYLLDDILQKVDRATMSQSLEGREPFLDQRIIEFAARLPDSYKYNEGVKKRILKDIVHQYIPKQMMERPKMGFAIPIGKWMQTDLRDLVESYLNEKRIREQGIFSSDAIAKLKRDFLNGKTEYEMKIWYLLTFQMWYDKWMK